VNKPLQIGAESMPRLSCPKYFPFRLFSISLLVPLVSALCIMDSAIVSGIAYLAPKWCEMARQLHS
jgi:hypothetical protein